MIDVCGNGGISVPDEVAVIGVDNDNLLCELSNPPLSSVDLNGQQAGYLAATTLDAMLRKGKSPDKVTMIEPLEVVVRRSTNVLAGADEDLGTAVRLIRERACSGIQVCDLTEALAISPSTLNRRFAKCLGRLPKDEIIRVRILERSTCWRERTCHWLRLQAHRIQLRRVPLRFVQKEDGANTRAVPQGIAHVAAAVICALLRYASDGAA